MSAGVHGHGGRAHLLLILSPERSGSTLLSVMLGAHARVVAPPELHLFRFADFDAWRTGYPAAMRSLESAWAELGEPRDEAALVRRYAQRSVDAVYEDLLERCGPGRILVDKTPAYGRDAAALERAEAFAPSFLWLVRHPLGVAASRIDLLRKRERQRARAGLRGRIRHPLDVLRREVRRRSGREMRQELSRWVETHEGIERFLARIDAGCWRRIHYEDLVRRPTDTLESLCPWLGIDVEPAMLDPRSHLPAGLGKGIGDGRIMEHGGVEASLADRWRERFSETDLDAGTRRVMDHLGVSAAGSQGAS